ncbi:MAG: ribosome small subunit-dependent GTPase A [Elusimicrobiales bacterium]|nr:ribosome small subunit-dependent GTPase A [Elusimicrobiales bacterium]
MPVVGDWVLSFNAENAERLPVYAILKRRTLIARKAAGKQDKIQPIAANADYVFIVQGLDYNFNIKRLDRYLTAVKNSGASPVIILNKADLCPEKEQRKKEAEAAAGNVPVILLDSVNLIGYDALAPYVSDGKTIAFIGSSGTGKSTIINCLGAEKQRTGAVKAKDGKGMHTTTTRRLIRLPGGALLVDTPGMKEFAAWEASAGLKENFSDIENLALKCRFSDCRHLTEPGCAVKEAVQAGIIIPERLENYRKIKAELKKSSARRNYH